jgi:hypothetical protein
MNEISFISFNAQVIWKITTDTGKVVILPCAPWVITALPHLERYAVICENKMYMVMPEEAKRIQIQCKMERTSQLLEKATAEFGI